MSVPPLPLAVFLSAALVAGAMACRGDAISGCGTPGNNQGIGISEECLREKHFRGCDLQLPHPPGVEDPLMVVTLDDDGDDEDVITVSYLHSKGTTEPSMLLTLSRDVRPADPNGPRFLFSDPAVELSVGGLNVLIEGDSGSRGAAWKSDCASYHLQAIGEARSEELDDVLMAWLKATLE